MANERVEESLRKRVGLTWTVVGPRKKLEENDNPALLRFSGVFVVQIHPDGNQPSRGEEFIIQTRDPFQ